MLFWLIVRLIWLWFCLHIGLLRCLLFDLIYFDFLLLGLWFYCFCLLLGNCLFSCLMWTFLFICFRLLLVWIWMLMLFMLFCVFDFDLRWLVVLLFWIFILFTWVNMIDFVLDWGLRCDYLFVLIVLMLKVLVFTDCFCFDCVWFLEINVWYWLTCLFVTVCEICVLWLLSFDVWELVIILWWFCFGWCV